VVIIEKKEGKSPESLPDGLEILAAHNLMTYKSHQDRYQSEGVVMPYTMEDFQKEVKEEVLRSLTEEELDRLLNGMKPEKRMKGLKPEERLKGLTSEEIEAYLKKIQEGAKG